MKLAFELALCFNVALVLLNTVMFDLSSVLWAACCGWLCYVGTKNS